MARTTVLDRNAKAVGPRVVGGVYRCGYWGDTYRVTDMQLTRDDWMGWSVTCVSLDGPNAGVERTHCTAWERGDSVVSLPQSVSL